MIFGKDSYNYRIGSATLPYRYIFYFIIHCTHLHSWGPLSKVILPTAVAAETLSTSDTCHAFAPERGAAHVHSKLKLGNF
jgi:hypothetical protein